MARRTKDGRERAQGPAEDFLGQIGRKEKGTKQEGGEEGRGSFSFGFSFIGFWEERGRKKNTSGRRGIIFEYIIISLNSKN